MARMHSLSRTDRLPHFGSAKCVGTLRAFTIVELLVVVALVTMLVGMMLPALGNARESARSARCAQHQRQLTIALTSYTGDHDGRFVPNRMHLPDNSAADSDYVVWWFGRELGGLHAPSTPDRPLDKTQSPLAARLGGDIDARLACPAFPIGSDRFYAKFDQRSAHFGYNESLAPLWHKADPPRRLDEVAKPTRVFAFVDAVHMDGFRFTPAGQEMFYEPHYAQHSRVPGWRTGFGHFRHAGRANIAMLDGHAASVEVTQPVVDWIEESAVADLDATFGAESVYGFDSGM